jgi:hypothetical protein
MTSTMHYIASVASPGWDGLDHRGPGGMTVTEVEVDDAGHQSRLNVAASGVSVTCWGTRDTQVADALLTGMGWERRTRWEKTALPGKVDLLAGWTATVIWASEGSPPARGADIAAAPGMSYLAMAINPHALVAPERLSGIPGIAIAALKRDEDGDGGLTGLTDLGIIASRETEAAGWGEDAADALLAQMRWERRDEGWHASMYSFVDQVGLSSAAGWKLPSFNWVYVRRANASK